MFVEYFKERGRLCRSVSKASRSRVPLLTDLIDIARCEGRVTYDGAKVRGLNHRVAYMTQQDHLLPWRTVSGNVSVPLEVAGLPKIQRDARIEELLCLVGLRNFAKSYPNQVSGGMHKRCALARLLAADRENASARRTVRRAQCATRAHASGRTAQGLSQTQSHRDVRDARHRRGGGTDLAKRV